jgi:hypothetical protein
MPTKYRRTRSDDAMAEPKYLPTGLVCGRLSLGGPPWSRLDPRALGRKRRLIGMLTAGDTDYTVRKRVNKIPEGKGGETIHLLSPAFRTRALRGTVSEV